MKTWPLMALFALLFVAVGAACGIAATVSGETWLLVPAAIFVIVGLIPALLVPQVRREQTRGVGGLAPVGDTDQAPDSGTWTFGQIAAELSRELAGTPYVVQASPELVRIHADLADAAFLDFAGVNKVKVVRGLDIVPDGRGGAMIRDFEQDLDLTAGVARLTGSARVFSGAKVGFERRIEWGVGADGDWKRQVDFSHSSKQLRGVATGVLERAGWYRGWFASLPTESKGALVIGLIGASAIPLVPIAFLIRYVVT